MAIGICRRSKVTELVPDLTSLALDVRADGRLRVAAALAVDDLTRNARAPTNGLVTLLRSPDLAPDDEETADDLEAAAAMASWPHSLTTAEVFAFINLRHPRNYRGIYSIFLQDLAERLTSQDLDVACDWLLADVQRMDDSRLAPLVDAIVKLCIDHIATPKARRLIKHVALRRANEYAPLFSDESYFNKPSLAVEDRHAIALLLFEDATENQVLSIAYTSGRREVPLLMSEDLPWLVDAYATAHGRSKDNLGRALGYMYDPTNPAHAELVLGLSEAHPASELFSYWRSFMPFDSPQAIAAQDEWRRLADLRHRGPDASEAPADEWVNPRISDEAAMAMAGGTQPFWAAVRLVTIRPGTLYYMDEHEPDLTSHPRWGTLPEQTRLDLIDAAPLYLMNGRCRAEEWLGRDRRFHPAEAGYRAFLLLLRERPTELYQLPGEVWREWAPILVGWPTTINGAKAEDKQALFAIAMPHARTKMTEVLLKLVDFRHRVRCQHIP
jgi:hypothetical protein